MITSWTQDEIRLAGCDVIGEGSGCRLRCHGRQMLQYEAEMLNAEEVVQTGGQDGRQVLLPKRLQLTAQVSAANKQVGQEEIEQTFRSVRKR